MIYSGIRIYFEDGDQKIDPEKNVSCDCVANLPITKEDHGGNFVDTRENDVTPYSWYRIDETKDLLFAVDSSRRFAITKTNFWSIPRIFCSYGIEGDVLPPRRYHRQVLSLAEGIVNHTFLYRRENVVGNI